MASHDPRSVHPPTSSYCLEPKMGEPRAGGGRPALIGSPEARALAGLEGWEAVRGLLVPARAAASWGSLARREPLLDLSGFEWESSCARAGGCDWKVFMEIYFDDYHVEPFHPGLSSLADCGALEWLWEPEAQAQRVGASARSGAGSQAHERLWRISREAFGPLPAAAVWAAVYPWTMVEWLAGGVAISVAEPSGPGRCSNAVSFCYPAGVASARPDFVKAHQAAYWETAREDDEIAARIQAGRAALAARGEHEEGPIHPHLEAGIGRFHLWLAGQGLEGASPLEGIRSRIEPPGR